MLNYQRVNLSTQAGYSLSRLADQVSLNRFRGLRPGKGMPAMKLAAWKDDVGGELGVFI